MGATDIVLSVPQARDIIAAAVEFEIIDVACPDGDSAVLEMAGDIVWQAEAAERQGIESDAVPTILKIARDRSYFDPGKHGNPELSSVEIKEEPEPEEEEPEEEPGPVIVTEQPEEPPLPPQEELDKQSAENLARAKAARDKPAEQTPPSDGHQPATRSALERVRKANLPIPPEIEGNPPTLPRDISKLSDIELRSLHGEFHACLARAVWLLALEEADHESAHSLREERITDRMRELEATADARSVTALKAEASDDTLARELRERITQHASTIRIFRALREVFSESCARISREMTFREMERESARPPAPRR